MNCVIQRARAQRGLSLLEMLIALAIGALLMIAVDGVIGGAFALREEAVARNQLNQRGTFALQRVLDAIAHSPALVLPLRDKPNSSHAENIREGTEPPTQIGEFLGTPLYGSGVLAVRLRRDLDLDADGIADADNDGDGRFDEDFPDDVTNDNDNGVRNIDDNGDGWTDNATWVRPDDDESLNKDEDPVNGIDDDGDNNIDEDPSEDMNGDGAPGVAGIDDDNDGSIDEGDPADDDEDGVVDEDWIDPHVFYLKNGVLYEQLPVPWDEDDDSDVDGRDIVTEALLENVTRFRVERLVVSGGRGELIDITLEFNADNGHNASLHARMRVGAAQ